MAVITFDSIVLKREYCNKPKEKDCPYNQTCYDGSYQCQYWKQEFETYRQRLLRRKNEINN